MKVDIPEAPIAVPRKRKQLANAPDAWLPQWLERDLSPSDRRRVLDERDERRRARKQTAKPRVVVLAGPEGATREQEAAVLELLKVQRVLELVVPATLAKWVTLNGRRPGRVLSVVGELGVDAQVADVGDPLEQMCGSLKGSAWPDGSDTLAVALPRSAVPPDHARDISDVWRAVRYARHRGIPVQIIFPDGTSI